MACTQLLQNARFTRPNQKEIREQIADISIIQRVAIGYQNCLADKRKNILEKLVPQTVSIKSL